MSDKFKAIVLNQSGDQFSREIKTLDKSFFKVGNVLVKVDYSGLNYKDALILKMAANLLKSTLIYQVLIFQEKLLRVIVKILNLVMMLF